MTAPSVPSTQTVAWIESPGPDGKLVIKDGISVQQPAENEVLVKLECSGVCHSDCHNVFGPPGRYTDIPGHEGVGEVVKLGPGASESLMHKRVGIKWVSEKFLRVHVLITKVQMAVERMQ
jgi:propanol-preferring alcohol dehydrogenase